MRTIRKLLSAMAVIFYLVFTFSMIGATSAALVGFDQVVNRHALFQFANLGGLYIAGVDAEQAAVLDNVADRIDAVRDANNRPLVTPFWGVNSFLGGLTVTVDLALATQQIGVLFLVIAVAAALITFWGGTRLVRHLHIVFGA